MQLSLVYSECHRTESNFNDFNKNLHKLTDIVATTTSMRDDNTINSNNIGQFHSKSNSVTNAVIIYWTGCSLFGTVNELDYIGVQGGVTRAMTVNIEVK